MPKSNSYRTWIYFLPALHLCGCIVIAFGHFQSGWEYLTFYIDYPISIFITSLLYSFDHPLVLFGIIGTLWWSLLSWLVIKLVGKLGSVIHNDRSSMPS